MQFSDPSLTGIGCHLCHLLAWMDVRNFITKKTFVMPLFQFHRSPFNKCMYRSGSIDLLNKPIHMLQARRLSVQIDLIKKPGETAWIGLAQFQEDQALMNSH